MSRPSRQLAAIVLSVLASAVAASPAAAQTGCTRVAAADGSDAAAGTEAAPYRTVTKLISALTDGQVGCLRGGVYSETSNGYIAKVSKPGISLRSYPGERARLVGIVYVTSAGTATRFSSLDFEGTGGSNTIKIYAADVVVEDSDITNASRGQSCMMLGSNSAGVGAAIRPVIRRNRFHACGSPANGNKDHAIYASNVEAGQITDNVIHDPSAWAIQLYPNARNTRFAHNVVDGGQTVRGGVVFGGDSLYASSGNVVEHNVLSYAATYAISSTWSELVGNGNVARGNCVFAPRSGVTGGEGGYVAEGTVVADPRFVDRAARDYRLAPDSPCLPVVGYDAAAVAGGAAAPAPEPAGTTEPAPAPEPAPTTEPAPAPTPEPEAPVEESTVNQAPSVSLTSPLDGSVFRATLSMSAEASDDGGVEMVEFYVDGKLRATDRSAPYAADYTLPKRLRRGTHKVVAKAYDGAGLSSTATVTVSGA